MLYETCLLPEHTYTFKHVLTHEVAYGSLLQEQRRLLHTRIVEAMEQLASHRQADQVERLAHHARRGEVWPKAFLYSRQAGAKALAGSAYREAMRCFEQALEALAYFLPDRPTREQAIDLCCDLSIRADAVLPMGAGTHTLAQSGIDRRSIGGSPSLETCLSPYSRHPQADARPRTCAGLLPESACHDDCP